MLRDKLISLIEYSVLWDAKVFIIPYPKKDDTKASSLKDFLTVDGYQILLDTIKGDLPLVCREAAFRQVIKEFTDQQLVDLIESFID